MSVGYRRAARRCRTVNQFNALHIALENRMTPLELAALRSEQGPWLALRVMLWRLLRLLPQYWHRAPDRSWPSGLRDRWLRKLHRLYMSAAKPRPEPFRRRKLSRHLWLYSSGGPRQEKTLLISFVGSSQRPFLPVPVFLQVLDASRVDVLLVGYPRGKGLRGGLPELGRDFEESIDKLRALADIDGYRRCVALGTSGGGTPAVLTALRWGLPAVLSAAGGGPTDARWLAALGEEVGDLAQRYAEGAARMPQVVLAYGADAKKDLAAAAAFAQRIPAELHPVHDGRRAVAHNIFAPLLRRRCLESFLESTVLQPPR
jgi:hypothetical protein